ncbi:hypothetical protein TcasGA2_TC014140 [Tribolium castaneum]|uniref:Uncharacterized protein n=1 Tax=Tribolium castaneum TaxID=7070 RepID=D6WKG4_TRICA|nr:hypothetical protein TcasGA2_TC014140 [Tribolium castaneum]
MWPVSDVDKQTIKPKAVMRDRHRDVSWRRPGVNTESCRQKFLLRTVQQAHRNPGSCKAGELSFTAVAPRPSQELDARTVVENTRAERTPVMILHHSLKQHS